jgi:hypothetical protein
MEPLKFGPEPALITSSNRWLSFPEDPKKPGCGRCGIFSDVGDLQESRPCRHWNIGRRARPGQAHRRFLAGPETGVEVYNEKKPDGYMC